jgi:hypothetical protein
VTVLAPQEYSAGPGFSEEFSHLYAGYFLLSLLALAQERRPAGRRAILGGVCSAGVTATFLRSGGPALGALFLITTPVLQLQQLQACSIYECLSRLHLQREGFNHPGDHLEVHVGFLNKCGKGLWFHAFTVLAND